MTNFVSSIRPVFNISFHSYSELVLYPYSCEGERTPTWTVVEALGERIASALPSDTGRGTYKPGKSWEILYGVDGGDIDWMYATLNVIPYVIELNGSNQGFQPSYNQWRQRTVEKLRAAWTLLFQRLTESGVRGVVTDSSGQAIGNARIKITMTANGNYSEERSVNPDGSFHFVLNPGEYRLDVTRTGSAAQSQTLSIGGARQDIDIVL